MFSSDTQQWVLLIVLALVVVGALFAYLSFQSNGPGFFALSTSADNAQFLESATLATGDPNRYIAPGDKIILGSSTTGTGTSTTTNVYNDVNGAALPLTKVAVSVTDLNANFLQNKLVAGTNVSFVHNNIGGNETLTIDATGATGPQGPPGNDGNDGNTGPQGPAGPNILNTGTSSDFNGVLDGNGTGIIAIPNNDTGTTKYLSQTSGATPTWETVFASIPAYVLMDGNAISRLTNDVNFQTYVNVLSLLAGYVTTGTLSSYPSWTDANNTYLGKNAIVFPIGDANILDVNYGKILNPPWITSGDANKTYTTIADFNARPRTIDTNEFTAGRVDASGVYLTDRNYGLRSAFNINDGNALRFFQSGNKVCDDSNSCGNIYYTKEQVNNLIQFTLALYFKDQDSNYNENYTQMSPALPMGGGTWSSTVGVTDTQIIANRLDDNGIYDFIPSGLFHVHTHVEKTAGTKTLAIYGDVYYRNIDTNVETLILTMADSDPLTTGVEQEVNLFGTLANPVDLNSNHRLLWKLRARVSGLGTDPDLNVIVGGNNAARLELPSSTGSIVFTETDPIWNNEKTAYPTWVDANSTYQPVGAYISDANNNIVYDANDVNRLNTSIPIFDVLFSFGNKIVGDGNFYFNNTTDTLFSQFFNGNITATTGVNADANNLFAFKFDVNSWGAALWQPIGNYLTSIPSYVLMDTNLISRLNNDRNYVGSADGNTLSIPTQTGNSGKFLTTDGSTYSWGTAGSGFTWNTVNSDGNMTVGNGYIVDANTLIRLYLPENVAVGSVIKITDKNAQGFTISQRANQRIYLDNNNTTTGTGGYLGSTLSTTGGGSIVDSQIHSWWKFDDQNASTSDYKNVLNGTNTGVVTSLTGIFGKDYNFSASSDRGIDLNGGWTPDKNFSINVWIKTTQSGSNRVFSNFNTGESNKGFIIDCGGTSNAPRFGIGNGSSFVYASTSDGTKTCDSGNWRMITGTYDGNGIKVYVDGTFVKDATQTTQVVYSNVTRLTAGAFYTDPGSYSQAIKGQLDEPSVYDFVLSQAQITALWNSGTGITPPFSMAVTTATRRQSIELVATDGNTWNALSSLPSTVADWNRN